MLPFEWDEIGVVSVDRFRDRKPECEVLVGRTAVIHAPASPGLTLLVAGFARRCAVRFDPADIAAGRSRRAA